MKNLTKPVLAAATIAAIASGLAVAQGGVANAADPTSDCAVAVSLPSTPIQLSTATTTSLDVTTTWTGACATEAKTAAATFSFVSAPSTDSSAVSTPIPTAGTFTSRTLALGTGTTTISVPTSALPAAGSYVQLTRVVPPTSTSTPTPTPTATPTTTEPSTGTVVTAKSNQEIVKNGSSANIKFSRSGKTATFVGHAYSYTPPVAPATVGSNVGQSELRVRLQKLVGTEFTTVASTTTSSTGRYEFAVSDTTGSTYRVATTETTAVAENDSPTIVATIDPHSATKVIRLKTVKVAKKVTVSGTLYTLKPVETKYKGTTGVAAYFQKKLNGSWVTIKKVRSTTGGSISGVANNVHKTTYRFVVIANSKYNTSTSASISR